MKKRTFLKWLAPTVALAAPGMLYSETYLSADQAKSILGGGNLVDASFTLTDAQADAIEKASKTRVRVKAVKAYRGSSGNYVIIDEVLGKHEFITYACGISAAGAVTGIEIMEYRETYGQEIKNPKWRSQFTGKTPASELVLDKTIKNISGATLSSSHITDGVKRLLQTWQVAMKK